MWSDIADIEFQRIGEGTSGAGAYSNAASILFGGLSTSSSYAYAYLPGSRAADSLAGDVFLNMSHASLNDMTVGRYGFLTVVHEIGHALGLTHPGAYNAAPGTSISYASHAEYAEDSRQYSVMSYFEASETGASHDWRYAATPLLHDIAAAQKLYGANTATRTGDTVYGFNSNADRDVFRIDSATDKRVFAIWDAGGSDTLDFSGYGQAGAIDLNAGAFSSVGGLASNVAIAQGATIENAIGGSGNDRLVGNALANFLSGGRGDDRLFGGEGDDVMAPGVGNDSVDGGAGFDVAFLAGLRSAWRVFADSDGRKVLESSGERDIAVGIERFRFDDAMLAFDFDGNAGKGYRIYQASFDRVPDDQGLAYWIRQLDKGMGLKEVAARFVDSAEFDRLYGTDVSNTAFVESLYAHVLDRRSDGEGFDFWVNCLDNGTYDCGDVLLRFSESAENVSKVQPAVQNGILITNDYLVF